MEPIKTQDVMKTPYQTAWEVFYSSSDYFNSVEVMIRAGLKQPYINNILRTAFDAGYNSKTNQP